ncbi:MAG: peroxidase-related enzyme [Aggregatilineales bacterium]
MTFIHTIPEDQATGDVQKMYEENRAEVGYVPNYVKAFSHRPDVMKAWGQLLGTIRSNTDARRYELVTLAAAHALKSSYCMLAHGSIMLKDIFSAEQLTLIAQDYRTAELTPAEVAMMAFAQQIVRDATAVTQDHIDTLHQHGFSDLEIFEISTITTARCFFSKTLDALGAKPDEAYLALDENLRHTLTVGRSIS